MKEGQHSGHEVHSRDNDKMWSQRCEMNREREESEREEVHQQMGQSRVKEEMRQIVRDRPGELQHQTEPLFRWRLFTLVIREPYHFPSFTERQRGRGENERGRSLGDIAFSRLLRSRGKSDTSSSDETIAGN